MSAFLGKMGRRHPNHLLRILDLANPLLCFIDLEFNKFVYFKIQCRNFVIFLSLRFYVKSILVDLETDVFDILVGFRFC